MKSEEGKVWPYASRGVEKDVHPAIIEILNASIQLGRAYGVGYFKMLLKGTDHLQWIKPQHLQIGAYGVLKDLSRDAIGRIFHYMVDEGYLSPANQSWNAFSISDKGRAYLEAPAPVFLQGSYLACTARECYLYPKLRAFRKTLAEDKGLQEYHILSDFTLDRIVMRLPTQPDQLLALPGFNPYKLEIFGNQLLALLQELQEDFKEVEQRRISYFNSKPDHQYVKRLVDESHDFQSICKAIGFEYVRVENILLDLARTGELNVPAWVEGQVNAKTLFRATEFFRKAQKRDIYSAQQTLHFDQPTLYLGRLYVKAMEISKTELKQAG